MKDRSTYIGSSDAADILAGNFDRLYDIKTGATPEPDLSDVFPVQLGAFVEEFHLDWTIRKLNEEHNDAFRWSKFAEEGKQHASTFKPDLAFNSPTLRSHPDALLKDKQNRVIPIEVKITGRFSTVEEAADFYMPQIQHHMICWNVDQLLFSVVIGTKEPQRIWVGASTEYQRHYLDRCDAFWGHIEAGIPPARQVYVPLGDKPLVPRSVADSVPFDGMTRRSIANDNRAPGLIAEFIETKKAVKRHDEVKKELTGMMKDDEREIYCDGFTIKRDKRGAKRITVSDESKFTETA